MRRPRTVAGSTLICVLRCRCSASRVGPCHTIALCVITLMLAARAWSASRVGPLRDARSGFARFTLRAWGTHCVGARAAPVHVAVPR